MLRRQLVTATSMVLVFTLICGLVYPLTVVAIGQSAFRSQANGSIVSVDGMSVGSELIGQNFNGRSYFHPRPSAAGTDGYDALASSASNLGPSNPTLIDTVNERIAEYREVNNLGPSVEVPVDAVTASGSGLDPHISVLNAQLQAPRIAAARNLDIDQVLNLIEENTTPRSLGFLGEPGVNVLGLNIALDRASTG